MPVDSSGSILLVDDDSSWQNINTIVLQKYGYRIDTASTRIDALRMILDHEYHIAVIDLRLQDDDQTNFDGIEVIKALHAKNPKTRILVKSGYLNPHIEEELQAFGIGEEEIFRKSTPNNVLAIRINKIFQELKQGTEE